ncbi:esterase/lipase family protein [Streptomyces anandii]|uniref:esterase/lipase family protein n=1 Tax=Streptomyces anandii TaxID=285454 RepID=UPI0037014E0F
MEERRRRRAGAATLMLLAAGLPALEAACLYRAGLSSIAGMAPQATAPPPFGVYHDLRWVFVYHHSWAALGGALAALVVFRTVLNTALVMLAWPPGPARPPLRRLVTSNALCVVLLVVILSPWVTLAAMGAATSLSWFVLSSLLPLVLLALVVNRGGIVPGWWRHPPSPVSVGIAVLTFLSLTAGSTAVSAAPGMCCVAAAFATGLVNAGLWAWLVRTVATRPKPVIPAFVTPLAIALVPALILGIGSQIIGLQQAPPDPSVNSINADHLTAAHGRQVIYLQGYGSSYTGTKMSGYPSALHFTFYSYRGQYADGAPLPYGPNATHQSLRVLADRLAQQVDTVHRRSGRTLAIVAQSEGTFIARTYLRDHPHPPVDTLVLLSPLVRPARIYYPPRAADSGWGLGLGWEMRMLTALSRLKTGSTVSADEPFVRSVMNNGPWYRNMMLCPVPGTRVVAFLPTASAAAVPPGHLSDVTTIEVEALHGTLSARQDNRRDITAVLTGKPIDTAELTAYRFVQWAAAGWQVPPLPLSYVPSWHAAAVPDSALDDADGCTAHSALSGPAKEH